MTERLTYVSLFSSAGIGCWGLRELGFDCLATNELSERRLAVQRANQVCRDARGYVGGDITEASVVDQIRTQVRRAASDLSLVIATPPCQGMSLANHYRKPEEKRNSLVLSALRLISEFRPKYYILENVRGFLNSVCTDPEIPPMTIGNAISSLLGDSYKDVRRVVNLMNHGASSSRTRSLVIGVRCDLDVDPDNLFPDETVAPTLRQLIGDLQNLTVMGEYAENDVLHRFRPYSPHMRSWIENLKPGQSAFENDDPARIPHRIVNGIRVNNQNKNGNKYQRALWDRVAPCVHTRNDIFASQTTIHPVDDRVFSIRELMRMMNVPQGFTWALDEPDSDSSPVDVEDFYRRHETNIRQCLGEAVPTVIFSSIAQKILECESEQEDKLSAIGNLELAGCG